MTSTHRGRNAEGGFTIIEVLMGATLLIGGVLGVARMADEANLISGHNKSRDGANNLARELLEDTRSFPYAQLHGIVPAGSGAADLTNAYAAIGVADASAEPGFQITRRGITYTVSVFSCVLDDPHDGVRSAPGDGLDANSEGAYCLGSPVAGSGATTDANPDDARKIEVSVQWSKNGLTPSCRGANQSTQTGATGGSGQACVTEAELIANPSGGLGPAIKTLSPPTSSIVEAGASSVTLNVTTASPAQSVTWTSDDGLSGTATPGAGGDGTQWLVTWGGFGPSSPVDGTHVIASQAFMLNAGGVPKAVPIALNRFIPAVPTGGTGGIDRRLSDAAAISWAPNSDQDILGYTVYRASGPAPNLAGGSADTPVCSTASVSSTLCFDSLPGNNLHTFATNAACTDAAAQAAGHQCLNYYVVAFDSQWTSIANPTTYSSTECPGLSWSPSVDVPAPPVSASRSIAPITSSSLWPTARAGCPSAYISIDFTAMSQNQAPDPPTALACASDAGQPVVKWTPPASPDGDGDDVGSYRIYRDPPSGAPAYGDAATTIGYNGGGTTAYRDASATGGSHEYWVTAVDERFQESDAQHITWTAAACP